MNSYEILLLNSDGSSSVGLASAETEQRTFFGAGWLEVVESNRGRNAGPAGAASEMRGTAGSGVIVGRTSGHAVTSWTH
jgi:hypothetical protein